MINDYKYHLAGRNDSSEARRKRICSNCGRKTFVVYIDRDSGQPLHETVGKCDRADKCAHHYTPKQYFADNNIHCDKRSNCPPPGSYAHQSPQKPQPAKPVSFIDNATFSKSLAGYENNTLINGLCRIAGKEKTMAAVRMYGVGTTKSGATIFWQLDVDNNVRTGKVIQYNPDLHRNKDKPPSWAHKALKLPDFHLQQCLFGEHLLRGNNKPVVIVESEKSAVIGSIYYPAYVWLATGGCGNLSAERCEPLRGRKVILYPDAGMYNKWKEKAALLSTICDVSVSDLIERQATEGERKDGLDIADFLLRNAPPTATEAPQPATTPEPPDVERLQPEAIKSIAEQETTAEAQETTQNSADEALKRMEYRKQFEIDLTNPTPPPDEDERVKEVIVLLKWGAVPYSYILSELKDSTGERGIDVYFRYAKPAIERGIIIKGKDGMCRLAAGIPKPFKEFLEQIDPLHNLRNHKDR
jgi:hypothetical protein